MADTAYEPMDAVFPGLARLRPPVRMIRRTALALALALLPVHASAGLLVCQFTEPFFSISFDSDTGVATLTAQDEADPETGKLVPRIIAEGAKLHRIEDASPPRMALQAGGEIVLDITISGQGSDGMSGRFYPMDGAYGRFTGGCEASKAPSFDLYDLYEDLGIAF